jgi:hypothetical protein
VTPQDLAERIDQVCTQLVNCASAKATLNSRLPVTLMLDTGDGKTGSVEDKRCDGCGSVREDGLNLLVHSVQPDYESHTLKFAAVDPDDPGQALTMDVPRLLITLGLCDNCRGLLERWMASRAN